MFTILFFCNTLTSFTICYFLFEIGEENLSGKSQPSSTPSKELHSSCTFYILAWISSQQFLINGSVGIMFCRFIYARYASGLVASGTILFHRLAAILIVSFISQFIKLCTLAPIAQNEFKSKNNGFAWKHKLIIITMMLLFIVVTLYFYLLHCSIVSQHHSGSSFKSMH